MRPIPEIAVTFVAAHEGLRLEAYRDPVGILTIGYGHTGPDVREGMTITEATARALLATDLQIAAARVEQRIGAVVAELTEHQWAALLSFVFNVGANASWTIWKRLKARQFDQVPLELMKFVNAGGRKLNGLVKRRAAECELWATDEPGSDPEPVPSSVTRAVATPPTPADPNPPQKSAQLISGGIAAATTTTVAVQQLTAQVAPFAVNSELVGRIVGLLALIGATAVIVGFVLAWVKKREARR